ncbi:MAG: hypothetical protein IPP73_01000 [Chitinophagaceae bacterium]|nr:hypothetical protein [Chitinophagaceae bacterium]
MQFSTGYVCDCSKTRAHRGGNTICAVSCSGTAITTIVMSGLIPLTNYNWTRDNTVAVTGIAASGSGNISGTLTNTTTAPVTVTFTITPDASGCSGTPITATVIVKPIPSITVAPTTATVCQGTITPINITAGSPGVPANTLVTSGAVNLSIPDNLPAGLTSAITVPASPAGAIVTGVDVNINMTHTWMRI